jgi:hypothetical protein
MLHVMTEIANLRRLVTCWVLGVVAAAAATAAVSEHQDKLALQAQVELLQARVPTVHCADVHVVCECPAYEEGWNDAEYAEGCIPTEPELSEEDIRGMCNELEEYGYVAGC